MFDGKTETLQTPGFVVVENGRIVGVGATAVLNPGATVVELGDATLLPGFMDAHVHLTFERGLDSRQDLVDGQARTMRLLEASVKMVSGLIKLGSLPLLKPARRTVLELVEILES